MRLSSDDWKAYAPCFDRDILAGILISTLDEAVRIAERFRVREKIAARAEYVRRSLRQDSDLPRE